VSNSYQASVEGFVRHLGVSSEEALALIGNSVRLAQNAAQNANKSKIFRPIFNFLCMFGKNLCIEIK
jgi:S-methylmethionine-dependent homocysteine/selenocysteine methylase